MKPLFLRFASIIVLGCWLVGCEPSAEHTDDVHYAPRPEIEAGSQITISGRLINTWCYSADDPVQYDTSLECAQQTTSQGLPVAVQEPDRPIKEAWILVTVPQIFMDYMHQTVRVQGEVRSTGVLVPNRVEIETDDGWMFIM